MDVGGLKGFSEEEKNKYINALNFIATHATFGKEAPDVKYAIEIRNHFAFLQGMIHKIEDMIIGEPKVYNPQVETNNNESGE